EPGLRVADRAQYFRLQVRLPADVVDHAAVERVEKHAVDGEVTALRIFSRRRERHRLGPAAIDIGPVRPKSRHLDLRERPVRPPRADDLDDAETHPDLDRLLERLNDVFRPGRRGDVVIGRDEIEQLVSDAPPGPVGLVARLAQAADDVHGEFAIGHGKPRKHKSTRDACPTSKDHGIGREVQPAGAAVIALTIRRAEKASGFSHQSANSLPPTSKALRQAGSACCGSSRNPVTDSASRRMSSSNSGYLAISRAICSSDFRTGVPVAYWQKVMSDSTSSPGSRAARPRVPTANRRSSRAGTRVTRSSANAATAPKSTQPSARRRFREPAITSGPMASSPESTKPGSGPYGLSSPSVRWCSTRCHSAKLLIGSPVGTNLIPSSSVCHRVSTTGLRPAEIPAAHRATLTWRNGQVPRF